MMISKTTRHIVAIAALLGLGVSNLPIASAQLGTKTSDGCFDDPKFNFRDEKKKSCKWVGLQPDRRCSKEWKGLSIDSYCPETCGTCPPNNDNNSACEDSNDLRHRDKAERGCDWVAKDTKLRCKKMWNGKKLKEHCPVACDACPPPSEGADGCCSLDYKQCISWCGPNKDSCKKCNHHDGVGWLENGPPQEKCKKRWKGCQKDPNSCCPGLTCREDSNDFLMCQPELPNLEPTETPTKKPEDNGCCTLNYKKCISWCGPTKESCGNCNHHDGVGWMENGPPQEKCKQRWRGCKNNPNSCCPGLACREDANDFLMCQPELPSLAPVPTAEPTAPPTATPTPLPTRHPTASPTASPTEYPTDEPTDVPSSTASSDVSSSDSTSVSFAKPTAAPQAQATGRPTASPTTSPTAAPQAQATAPPTASPTYSPTAAPQAEVTAPPTASPTISPTAVPQATAPPTTSPTASLTIQPIPSPTPFPQAQPTPSPQEPNNSNGCCSLDYKNCVNWCGSDYDSCMNCDNTDVAWLPNGAPSNSQCGERWAGCDGNNDTNHNGCCSGLTCQWRSGYNYMACLPNLDPTAAPVPPPPTYPPTNTPTVPIEPTISPAPTPKSSLLNTDYAMNAWDVYLGLDYITHKNSINPPNYALVASGGAAGSGNLVVSESQAYGLLITGSVLASWDTHAGRVANSKRSDVIKSFEGYFNFWMEMCKNSSNKGSNCQSSGNYCESSSGTKYVCLPDWRHYKTGGSEATGPAPDADEDAIVGIMLAVKAVENDANKPVWYETARKWADASATAFFEFEVDKSKSDHRLVKLGSCWGGWGGDGNNPSYHSPGSFRVMRDYQKSFPSNERNGYSAITEGEWNKLVDTSHEVLRAVQCSGDGALVPNWATIGVDGSGNIIHTGSGFSGSGTPQYEYGAEAARTTFRVALDAAFYPEMSSEWSPYLSRYNSRLNDNFQNGSFSSSTFPSCRGPNTNQDINMFGGWQSNAFIYGPTYTTLIAASGDIANADAMIDTAGKILGGSPLPGSYYPRSWAMIANLMLNGAMESAGNTLKN